jgi:hypothetical protein
METTREAAPFIGAAFSVSQNSFLILPLKRHLWQGGATLHNSRYLKHDLSLEKRDVLRNAPLRLQLLE